MNRNDSGARVALVTGGAMGIGAAISQRLARDGYTVLVSDINLEAATATADKINADGGKAAPLAMDVSKPESIGKAFADVEKDYGRCDVLVNNA
ncbi:SDR family NAD(P)-dependent oxidoreductase, partial [Herbaspirillum lusitanum]|uniref:SDR family NAD(P)-dependent oxidoreductase n=1 Tax=Herbaspirillum lusitanum TaxID=213312 RepID=UPI00037C921F